MIAKIGCAKIVALINNVTWTNFFELLHLNEFQSPPFLVSNGVFGQKESR